MPPHILTIDDEECILQIVKEYLELNDFRVTAASTPRAALDVVERDPPDLVITDLQLPESDGLELIPLIQQRIPKVPIILLTGVHFDAETIDQNLSHKVSDYLNKTAPLSTLLEKVNAHLARA